MADTLTTGFGIINNDAKVKAGESVVIFGVGGIGLGVVLGAKLAGADPIIGIDLHDHKLAKAAEYGLTHQINASRENAADRVKEILGGLADVTIDGTGNPKVIETAYDLAKLRGGRCVLFGVMPSDQRVSIHTLPLHFGRTLTGSEGGQSRPEIDIPEILRVLGERISTGAGSSRIAATWPIWIKSSARCVPARSFMRSLDWTHRTPKDREDCLSQRHKEHG